MGMSHILPPNQVVHLTQNGGWRDRFTACAAGKASGKGNRSTRVGTLLKYIQIVPWALELTALVSRMQNLHRLLGACFTWGSPSRRYLLLSGCSNYCSAFISFSCSAAALGILSIRRWTPCSHLPCLPGSLLSCSPGAAAPPPGAPLGAAGAQGRELSGILIFQEGWVCRAGLDRRLPARFRLGKSCKSRVRS